MMAKQNRMHQALERERGWPLSSFFLLKLFYTILLEVIGHQREESEQRHRFKHTKGHDFLLKNEKVSVCNQVKTVKSCLENHGKHRVGHVDLLVDGHRKEERQGEDGREQEAKRQLGREGIIGGEGKVG